MPVLSVRASLLACVASLLCGGASAGAAPEGEVAARAGALVGAMTLTEKLGMVEGDTVLNESGTGTDACIGHISAIVRLKIPALCMGDGLAGVGNGMTNVTQFPAPLALAASWDTGLAEEFGIALGAEHAGKGRNVVLAPTINIIRTPLWGRIAETLSEDPYLTAQMAAPIVRGIQSNHVIATPKHFVANNQEWLRLGDAPGYAAIDAVVPERALREIYFPAFKAVTESGAGSIMCAYNRVNTQYACENAATLTVPRREWGFDGFYVSDWYFAHRSTVAAARAGLDISMPGGKSSFGFADFYGAPLRAAIADGRVPQTTLDAMVRHIVSPMIRLGLFDHPLTGNADTNVRSAAHSALARRIVEEGTVLLRNTGSVLPLDDRTVHSIAVIGDDAGKDVQTSERYGGFVKGDGIDIVSPLEAIRSRAGPATIIRYARGTQGNAALPTLPEENLRSQAGTAGFTARFFANGDWRGTPMLVQQAPVPDAKDVRPRSVPATWSGRWEGTFSPPTSGRYRFSVEGGGEIALFVDGKRIVYAPKQNFRAVYQGMVDLTAGRAVTMRLDYSPVATIFPGALHLGWQPPAPSLIDEAAAAAKASQVAIVFVADVISEGADRSTLSLPGDQDALIEAVAAVNPRTIVVLHTAGPVLMPWKDRVAGIIAGWYPGEEASPGLASILFGDVDPSGRLPVTFPASEADTPMTAPDRYKGIGTTSRYDEGLDVGYRWYAAHHAQPLYPFGFGLSYTDFAFSAGTAKRQADGRWTVTASVRNTGSRAGTAVAELYLTFPPEACEPPRQLKGFSRVPLNPGEDKTVVFDLPRESFQIWENSHAKWRDVEGQFIVEIGSSSRDIALTQSILARPPKRRAR